MKAEQAAIDAAKAQAADPASQGDNDTKLDTIDGGVITDGGPAHQWPIIEEPTKAEGGIVDDLPNAPSLDDIPKQKTTEL